MQRKPRGLSVHCSVPVCVRHPLVRRRALGTGRDPAARFSFLPLSSGNSSLLPSLSDRSWVALIVACLGSRCCLVTCYCGRWTQVEAGGHLLLRIPPPAEKANLGLRLAKQLLTLCRYKKGIKPLFMTKMNEKINIRSTWVLRLAKQPLTDVTE